MVTLSSMKKLEQFESILTAFDDSLKIFDLDKDKISKKEDLYLIRFKRILSTVSELNLFFYKDSSKEFRLYIDYYNHTSLHKLI